VQNSNECKGLKSDNLFKRESKRVVEDCWKRNCVDGKVARMKHLLPRFGTKTAVNLSANRGLEEKISGCVEKARRVQRKEFG